MSLNRSASDDSQADTQDGSYTRQEPAKYQIYTRLAIFLVCACLIVAGRFNVPDNSPTCVVDVLMNCLNSFNTWIENNPAWRNALQILCSAFMDVMFISTGIYWILRGNSSRLIIATLSFYIIRAIVQALWFSPFPEGYYWWMDPGFPSLVVPYGRGSDFFFSGHIGFVVICASEWKKNGFPIVAAVLALGGIYTGFILLGYHVHYSIDLFTGATFAHYMYIIVDHYKEPIDRAFIKLYNKIRTYFGGPQLIEREKKDTEQEFL